MEEIYIQTSKYGSTETWYTGKLQDVPKEDTDFKRHKVMSDVQGKITPPQLTLQTRSLIHVTTVERAAEIIKKEIIRGGEKELNHYDKLNLFWFGLSFNPEESTQCMEYERSMSETLRLHPEELDLFSSRPFKESSVYGNVKFTFCFQHFLNQYEDMINCRAQFRILGTFRYKKEMNHTILVHPENMGKRFKDLPKLENEKKVKLLGNRSVIAWKPQSTSCHAGSWEQVTFAFLMEKGGKNKHCELTLDSTCTESYAFCDIAKPTLVNNDDVYDSKTEANAALRRLLKNKY